MPLKTGRLPAHMGSFAQASGSLWAKHQGVLADDEFLEGARNGRRAVRSSQGRALMAKSLARTKAGYKHKGGNTAQREKDAATQAETSELRKTVEAQNDKILELEGRLTPEIATPESGLISPGPEEPVGNMDETNII